MKSLQRSRLAIVLAGWLLVDCSSGAASPPSRDAVMVGGPGDAQTPPTSSPPSAVAEQLRWGERRRSPKPPTGGAPTVNPWRGEFRLRGM